MVWCVLVRRTVQPLALSKSEGPIRAIWMRSESFLNFRLPNLTKLFSMGYSKSLSFCQGVEKNDVVNEVKYSRCDSSAFHTIRRP